MPYYYVKYTGSQAGTGGTTKQTGAFSGINGDYLFDSIADAITAGAGAGDYICVSDSHANTGQTAAITWVGASTAASGALYIISVDDANCDTKSIASSAQEATTSTIAVQEVVVLDGVYIKTSDALHFNGSSNLDAIVIDCTIEVNTASDRWMVAGTDGANILFINTSIIGVSGAYAQISFAGRFEMRGGTLSGITDQLLKSSGGFGGAAFNISGVDLSSITGTIFKDLGGSALNDDVTHLSISGCKLNSGATYLNETIADHSMRLEITNSAATSAAAEYQFHYESFGGYVDDITDSGIHRDESTAFPSGTKVSAHCVTSTDADISAPFWFDLPARFAELSDSSSDVLRIYLTSTSTLTDLDVYADVVYPDGTNNHEYHYLSSRPANPLATASELTEDTGSTWKDGASDLGATYNEYYIDLDTGSNDVGADCVPIIRIYVTTNATIYFDTTVGTVA